MVPKELIEKPTKDFYDKIPKWKDGLVEQATLYHGWKPWHGIIYPTTIKVIENGKTKDVTFNNYNEHHEFIWERFHGGLHR